jgi:hypothetical protein
MKSIGDHDDELGLLIPDGHLSDEWPANPSNTSLSVVSREG